MPRPMSSTVDEVRPDRARLRPRHHAYQHPIVSDRREIRRTAETATIRPSRIGMVGAKTMVDPEGSLKATQAVDFVCREEFDYTCKEVADGTAVEARSTGFHIVAATARIVHNPPRAIIENMDELPFVAPVYRRDLKIEELLHRLLETSLRELLHRPRLPLEMHVLPVAADRRRPPLSRAFGGERSRGSALDQGEHAGSEGDHVR